MILVLASKIQNNVLRAPKYVEENVSVEIEKHTHYNFQILAKLINL